jgi:hypothetical protein
VLKRTVAYFLCTAGAAAALAACTPPVDADAGPTDAGEQVDPVDAGSDAGRPARDAGPAVDAGFDADAGGPPDGGWGPDAGPASDGGVSDGGADAGHRLDAGPAPDGGADAGLPLDAGPAVDAGVSADAGLPLDAGPAGDGGYDAGPFDAGLDAGTPDAGFDAGPLDAGFDAGPFDAGFDAGYDAGPDLAGDLLDPLDTTLPFDHEFDLRPAGDADCVRFTVDEPGTLTLETGNVSSATCQGGDTKLWLYADGATDIDDELSQNDDAQAGTRCSRIVFDAAPGTYVACVEHWSRFFPSEIRDVTFTGSIDPWECNDGTLDPLEECDGASGSCVDCLFTDGTREDEPAGNDVFDGSGVKTLSPDEVARGTTVPVGDVDWWRIDLPEDAGPGALVVEWGDADASQSGCGRAGGVDVEVYAADGSTPLLTVDASGGFACGAVAVALPDGVASGGETFYVRVTSNGVPYRLIGRYASGLCGDGQQQPWEQCDPARPEWSGACDARCVPLAPLNDTCATAIDLSAVIPIDGSEVEIVGTSFPASNNSAWTGQGFCQSTTGDHVDVHYGFTAPIDGRVVFDLDTPSWDGVLYAFDGECVTPLICDDFPEEIEFDVAKGLDYSVVVDGYSGGGSYRGDFTLRASYLVAPANDQCDDSSPIILPLDGTAVRLAGTTRAATDDAAASGCSQSSTSDHRDVFYTFLAVVPGDVVIEVDSQWDGLLHVRAGCDGAELGCSDTPERVELTVQTGDVITAVVDAWGSSAGRYDLTARYAIPAPELLGGETCAEATLLPTASGRISGTLDGAVNDHDPSDLGGCTGFSATGPDVVYAVDVPSGETLTASLLTTVADGALYVLADCSGGANSCVDGSDRAGTAVEEDVTWTNNTGSAQRYYLVVDEFVFSSGSADAGAYELEWWVAP